MKNLNEMVGSRGFKQMNSRQVRIGKHTGVVVDEEIKINRQIEFWILVEKTMLLRRLWSVERMNE